LENSRFLCVKIFEKYKYLDETRFDFSKLKKKRTR